MMLKSDRDQAKVCFHRDDTKAIKGVAVLLMLFHHIAGFTNRLPVGFGGFASGVDNNTLYDLAMAASICVPLFFFLGGYGLYIKWRSSRLSVTNTILRLYKSYWKVFFLFVPIAFLLFRRSGEDINVLCTWYNLPRVRDYVTAFVAGFFGFSDGLNGEWWFLISYVCIIPLGYLFCCIWKKHCNFWAEMVCVIGLDVILRDILWLEGFSFLQENIYFEKIMISYGYSSAFFAGIVFAKYDGICYIKRRLRELPCGTLLSLLGVAALLWGRAFIFYEKLDVVCCALLVPMLSVAFDAVLPLKNIFVFFGKHSTNMWLIHSFYCYYFLEFTKIVYFTPNLWIDLSVLIGLTLVSSMAVNAFWTVGAMIYKKQCIPVHD